MNLVSLDVLRKKIKSVGMYKEIESVGYSKVKNKKYYVVVNGKKIHFGDKRYEDFLVHKDPERRKRYRLRHAKDNINEPSSGRCSWYLLW